MKSPTPESLLQRSIEARQSILTAIDDLLYKASDTASLEIDFTLSSVGASKDDADFIERHYDKLGYRVTIHRNEYTSWRMTIRW